MNDKEPIFEFIDAVNELLVALSPLNIQDANALEKLMVLFEARRHLIETLNQEQDEESDSVRAARLKLISENL